MVLLDASTSFPAGFELVLLLWVLFEAKCCSNYWERFSFQKNFGRGFGASRQLAAKCIHFVDRR
ncbi:hypothetical protein ACP4OV_022618 [Aristida adscensionis]